MSSAAPSRAPDGLDPEERALLEDLVDAIERPRVEPDFDPLDAPDWYRRSTLPKGKVPGFGEIGEKCGDFTPEAMYYCPGCGHVREFPHNCYQYDCPDHGLYAVRRRAAGTKDASGVVPKLGALRAVLDSRDEETHWVFHHFTISLGTDYFFRSDKPMERGFQLCRELMDVIDVQGLVALHPWRGEGGDDRGFWKTILGEDLSWPGAREQLEYAPHFHVVGVGPRGGIPGGAVSRALEAETGVIIERFSPENSNVSVYDGEAMARAATYTLSHSMVYTSTDKSRRLAARMKGPDVNEIEVYEKYKKEHQANVYAVAEDVLGIPPPDMECDQELSISRSAPIAPEPGPARSSSSAAPSARAGMEASTTPAGSTPSTSTATERCGTRLRHISTAGEVLPELTKRDDVDASDLDVAYRSYVDVMTVPEIPEFQDRPPPEFEDV